MSYSQLCQLHSDLENLLDDAVDAYPDNDSKKEGYVEGLRDAIRALEKVEDTLSTNRF